MIPFRSLGAVAGISLLFGCQQTTVRVQEPAPPPAHQPLAASAPAPPQALAVDDLAHRDDIMQAYVKQRDVAQDQLAHERLTKLDAHPDVKRLVDQIDRLDQMIASRKDQLRKLEVQSTQ